jgi:hypothetical protein
MMNLIWIASGPSPQTGRAESPFQYSTYVTDELLRFRYSALYDDEEELFKDVQNANPFVIAEDTRSPYRIDQAILSRLAPHRSMYFNAAPLLTVLEERDTAPRVIVEDIRWEELPSLWAQMFAWIVQNLTPNYKIYPSGSEDIMSRSYKITDYSNSSE